MSERNTQRVETTLQPAPHFSSVVSDNRKASVIAWLEDAAEAGNENAFVITLRELEGEDLSAEEFVHLIKLALEAGAHMAARHLSSRGASLYPSNPELPKYARLLAPPKIFGSTPASPESIKEMHDNRTWMRNHGATYLGKWVVLRHGELLGAGDSLAEAVKNVDDKEGIFVTIAY